jgi:ketosteroid isomerase-like protein
VRTSALAVVSITLAFCNCGFASAEGTDDGQVVKTIIAIVEDGLERLRNGDPRGITSVCAEDVTYFSVEQDSLLVGRLTLEEMYGPPSDQTHYDHFDLINPTVQVHGDVAILAFDYESFTTEDDSQLRTRWRSTHVLARVDADWRIVHIHRTLLENNMQYMYAAGEASMGSNAYASESHTTQSSKHEVRDPGPGSSSRKTD